MKTTTLLEVKKVEVKERVLLLDPVAPLLSSCDMGKQEEITIITGSIQIFP